MLTLAPIFQSGMVLQRDRPLTVWGTASRSCWGEGPGACALTLPGPRGTVSTSSTAPGFRPSPLSWSFDRSDVSARPP